MGLDPQLRSEPSAAARRCPRPSAWPLTNSQSKKWSKKTFKWQRNVSLLNQKMTRFTRFIYWIQWLKKKSLCHVKSKLCNSKPGSNLCVNPRRSSKFMIACTASSCQEWTGRTMAHLHTVLMRSEKPSDDYFSIAMMACIFSCLLTPKNLR